MESSEDMQSPRKLIVGLGNPGSEYQDTRHNFGFWVVDELARRLDVPLNVVECQAIFAQTARVDLAKPQTYMNRSGYALRCLVERWSYDASNILVIYDEVALPLGRLRIRAKGSPGGHRGMESVIENLRTSAVPRMRLGIAATAPGAQEGTESEASGREGLQEDIGNEERDLADFVLGKFTEEELSVVQKEVQRAADACLCWLENGVADTMNRFNA